MTGPRTATALSLLAFAALPGCDDGPTLHPVTGTVTFADGRPVADATVEFAPTAGGPAARARLGDGGRFTLTTGEKDGAVAGEHRVVVVQAVLMDGLPGHARHAGRQTVVAPRYRSFDDSGLRATVTADGGNDFGFVVDSAAR